MDDIYLSSGCRPEIQRITILIKTILVTSERTAIPEKYVLIFWCWTSLYQHLEFKSLVFFVLFSRCAITRLLESQAGFSSSSSNSMVCPAHSAAPCPSKVEPVIWASSITGCFISGCPVFSYLPIYPVPSSRALETWRALKSLWWDWTDTPCLSNMACSLPPTHHTITVIPTCCQSTADIRKQYGYVDVDVKGCGKKLFILELRGSRWQLLSSLIMCVLFFIWAAVF